MVFSFRFLKQIPSIALCGTLFVSTAASAAECYGKKEYEASHIRQLQTEFMVAALQCENHPTLDIVGKYNSFIQKYKAVLSVNAADLKGHFSKKGGQQAFDGFMTMLANDASERGKGMKEMCMDMDKLLDQALLIRAAHLQPYASSTVSSYSVAEPCKGVSASTAYAKPVLAAAPVGALAKTAPAKKTPAKKAPVKKAPAKK